MATKPENAPGQNHIAHSATLRATTYSDDELAYFKDRILTRKVAMTEDIERLRNQLMSAKEQVENDPSYSSHMADIGTDATEIENLYLMIARQQKFVGYLDRALDRIEKKTYGMCRETGKTIPKERLEAVPHTQVCIEVKKKQRPVFTSRDEPFLSNDEPPES